MRLIEWEKDQRSSGEYSKVVHWLSALSSPRVTTEGLLLNCYNWWRLKSMNGRKYS